MRPQSYGRDAQKILIYLSAGILLSVIFFLFAAGAFGAGMGKLGELCFLIFNYLSYFGRIVVRLFSMVAFPLVFVSCYLTVKRFRGPEASWIIGSKSFLYSLSLNVSGAFFGLIIGPFLLPRLDASLPKKVMASTGFVNFPSNLNLSHMIGKTLEEIVPANPFQSFAEGHIVSILFFGVICGLLAHFFPKKSEDVTHLMEGVNSIFKFLIKWFWAFIPLGLFFLVADFGRQFQEDLFKPLYSFIIVYFLGLFLLAILQLMVTSWALRKKISTVLRSTASSLGLAFGSGSSVATIPVVLENLEEGLKVHRPLADLIIPLGSVFNRAGTALYISLMTYLVAYLSGVTLGLPEYVLLILGSTLGPMVWPASFGAGAVGLAVTFRLLDLPMESIPLLAAMEWLFLRLRSPVDLLGNISCAAFLDLYRKKNQRLADEV